MLGSEVPPWGTTFIFGGQFPAEELLAFVAPVEFADVSGQLEALVFFFRFLVVAGFGFGFAEAGVVDELDVEFCCG